MTHEWKRKLAVGAARLGIDLAERDAERLAQFSELLVTWGRTIDLTSVLEPEAIRERHLLDSIAAQVMFPSGSSIVDLGSGAGFPGLVLSVVRSDLTITSVEARAKKCAFQRQVVRELRLRGVEVVNARAEEVIRSRPAPDWVTARALASVEGLVQLSSRWLLAGTRLLAMKSSGLDEELQAAAPTLRSHGLGVLETRALTLPESGDPRVLLVIGRCST